MNKSSGLTHQFIWLKACCTLSFFMSLHNYAPSIHGQLPSSTCRNLLGGIRNIFIMAMNNLSYWLWLQDVFFSAYLSGGLSVQLLLGCSSFVNNMGCQSLPCTPPISFALLKMRHAVTAWFIHQRQWLAITFADTQANPIITMKLVTAKNPKAITFSKASYDLPGFLKRMGAHPIQKLFNVSNQNCSWRF